MTIWENTFRRPLLGAGNQSILASRELADGTTLTVVEDNFGLTALQYDHAGHLLQSTTFYPVYLAQAVAIDPFGSVFVASIASEGYGYEADLWLDKYDGLTGQALWPAGVTYGAGNHQDDSATALLIDPAGDLVVGATDSNNLAVALVKYAGSDGSLVWGPTSTTTGTGSYAPVALDPEGNVYLAHRINSGPVFHLEKRDAATGTLVWQHDEAGHDLEPNSIGIDGFGNVVAVGHATSAAQSIEADKYSGGTGQRIWGPVVYTAGDLTSPVSATLGSDGSAFVYGVTAVGSQISDFVLKFRGADGTLEWGPVDVLPAGQDLYTDSAAVAGNGDLVISVLYQTGSSRFERTFRFGGGDGSVVWGPQTLANAGPASNFVASNGRVFVAADVMSSTTSDAEITELDGATGIPAWGPTTFTGVAADYAYFWDLTSSPDGDVIVTGQVTAPDQNGAWATFKFDRNIGGVVWGPVYLSTGLPPPTYSPWRVLTDSAGDVFVGGATSGGMTVAKYSGSTGDPLWSWTGVPGSNVVGLAVDSSGNASISGYVFNGSNYDVETARISGTTGIPIWGPVTYDSGSDDFSDFVAADSNGNVILVGHSNVMGPPGFLIKYAAADGSVIWGPVTQSDDPTWLAVDASGDIFRESYEPITTTKFSGATGAVIWGPISAGSEGGAYGIALALDASGNVFVTGNYYNGQTFDYAVIKYRGSDGTVLWGPVLYDGGGEDYPYDVVVDGSGNAVVTGTSDAGSDELKTATLSYDGATGALRWGPVGRNIARDSVNGLAASGSTVFVGATRGDLGYIVDAIDETLGVAMLPGALPAASCGHALDIPLGAVNGTPPYTWSIIGGGLPPDVVLGANGDVIGTPSEEGVFAFNVQVQDSASATVTRDFTLAVGPSGPLVPVSVARDPATCQLTLSVGGSYAAYDWLPGGQSTPTITVDPTEPTPYGVILNDGSTCAVRGAVAITPVDPSCLLPTLASISPTSGPDAGTPVVVTGTKFDPSVTLSIGGQPATGLVFQDASTLDANTPPLGPGTVADVLVVNPDGRYAMLLRSFASDFLDVSSSNAFYADIMKVLRAGITAGCGSGNYCSMDPISRAQMGVFLLKAEHGFFHVPPPCTGVFADVPCPGGFAVNWIEELAAEGITGGCGGGDYCPSAAVTRAQMAVFLLKAEHGSSYVPPPCTGIFGDVPCPGPVADWIEQLYHEGITGGCGGGNYCPGSPNTRGQMAVFLAKTFGLP